MARELIGKSIYLLPGMQVKLRIPINSRRSGYGWFAATKDEDLQKIKDEYFSDFNNPGEFTRGFVVEDTDIGNLTNDTEEANAVIYTHNKAYNNAIWFFATTGDRGLISIVSVPIHDHSSIVQGGPAFGTYFSDDEERTSG